MAEILNFPAQYGGPIEVELEGLDELMENLSALAQNFPGEVGNALRAECEIEMTEAKKRTPVASGSLRASGHVIGPEQDGPDQVVTLGFGGPAGSGNHGGETNEHDVGYAVYVHESMEALHPVGQAKFLESTILEAIPYLAERVAQRIALTRSGS